MATLLKIVKTDTPQGEKHLRKISEDVSFSDLEDKDFQSFLDDLVFTAQKVVTEEGYTAAGLAAIQVGKEKNVFCILREENNEFEIMINPEVKIINQTRVIGTEACLSVPDVVGKVSRFKKIKIKYLNRKGNVQKGVFSNQEAREIQHELDHTQGVLFIDKLID